MLHLKIVHYFPHVRQIDDVFIYEENHIYTAIPMYNLTEHEIIIQIQQEPYGI